MDWKAQQMVADRSRHRIRFPKIHLFKRASTTEQRMTELENRLGAIKIRVLEDDEILRMRSGT